MFQTGLPFFVTSLLKLSTVEIARGRDAHFKKGMRLPFSEVHRSESEAIHGSVIASKSRPKAVMPPTIPAFGRVNAVRITFAIMAVIAFVCMQIPVS